MNNGKQNSRFVKETGLTPEKRKTLYIFFIAVFVIAAIGLTLTLTLRSCSKSENSSPKTTAATEKPTTSVLPTIAVTGDPIESAEDVLGVWTTDGITIYEFNDDSTGTLKTGAADDSIFYYSVEDGVLYIDFADDSVTDASYNCHIDGNTLYFDNTENQQMYTLKRQ